MSKSKNRKRAAAKNKQDNILQAFKEQREALVRIGLLEHKASWQLTNVEAQRIIEASEKVEEVNRVYAANRIDLNQLSDPGWITAGNKN